ncbi:hypothetical protein P175DRAFT_0504780 [Aspergillus ochraceoroseus IBT 24754]|uniref:Sulfhydryl oxidase n=2 Tax=Aspergillus subgen. Nidulantes TaxID=2720870 RepID=A0A0F8UAX6_9EURO|nr:uncharacterized protein P175DRAFT_0504780 [Aspergillus ochraceoroseus IBT 24754]KKK16703.1 putative FAD dependent sulfhydryl oxidase Erv1 [Aspergillus rambellii]PTU17489.1 hypothetical protein P175DRAFT_0504780 [Aspergillus ochraceoroseus IBT 24754]
MADIINPGSQATPPKTLFIHKAQAAAGAAASSSSSSPESKDDSSTTTPPAGVGVVLDKDGKPCRLCTSAASWRNLTKQAKMQGPAAAATPTSKSGPLEEANAQPSARPECPPDVEELGRSTWTFLHSLTAAYPTQASTEQQAEMRTFLKLFSRLYPCWVCADDLRTWMAEPSGKNAPRLGGRSDFGTWMCQAHNEVNRKLGKKEFDCRFWEERWRTGWKDGRCD